MTERKFKPGMRDKRFTEGRMSDERHAWLQTSIGQFVIMKYDEPWQIPDAEETITESGPTIRLMLPSRRGRSIFYNLTALTYEELKLLREFFNLVFDLAEPITQMRDKEAQDAYDRGDDSFTRIFRQVPRLVVRARKERADGASLRERPDDPASGHGEGVDPDGGVPVGGVEVADQPAPGGGPQDDDAQAD